MNLSVYLAQRQQRVNAFLDRCVPATLQPEKLAQAMRYSLLSDGKRVRPILAIAACEAVGGQIARVLSFAGALEMIHAYSLIHDDLPAMDDDDMRRGRPTNHIVFGEGMAILAGDALLTEAFRLMGEAAVRAGARQAAAVEALVEIAKAAGAYGMVGGQVADIDAEGSVPDLPLVEFIHVRKTGALIRAAVRSGALLGGARPHQMRDLTRYGELIGLAFQVADDILDAEAPSAFTGKNTGRDRERQKATFPAVLGLPAAKDHARSLLAEALATLLPFGPKAEPLAEIARFVVGRAC
ncbi:MAG: farnesyl diphosphate synthase [Candidatus Binatia bacterium]